MTLINKLNNFYKRRNFSSITPSFNKFKNLNLNSFIALFAIITLFSFSFYIVAHVSHKQSLENKNNLNSLANSNEFSNLANFFISKLNSPYSEIKYLIKNHKY